MKHWHFSIGAAVTLFFEGFRNAPWEGTWYRLAGSFFALTCLDLPGENEI